MSLFNKRRYLFEADDDEVDAAGTTDEAPADAAEGESSDTNEDSDATEEETNTEDDGIDVGDGDDDFSIDAEPDDNMDSGDDSTSGSSDSGSSSEDEPPEVSPDSLKAHDKELYADLEPAEQELMIKTLKEDFIVLYQNCNNTIDKINALSIEFDQANEQLKRTVNILFTLKKMVSDYLLHIFDSKSVIENKTRYDEYLLMLNTVKNITKDLEKAQKDTNSAS